MSPGHGVRLPAPMSDYDTPAIFQLKATFRPTVSTIDAWLAALREETRQSRIRRGRDAETGELIKEATPLRADLAPQQRAEALRIGRIGFASAGAKRKPKEAAAA